MRAFVAMLLLAVGGVAGVGAQAPVGRVVRPWEKPAPAESLALERTRCLGTCPAYRVMIDRAGRVRFESRSDRTRGADSVGAAAFALLLGVAESAGFFELPARIDYGDAELCADYATDHPAATVTLYWADSLRQVVHYHGCYSGAGAHDPGARLRRLYALENAIESVAGSWRWVRPARRR